MTERFTVDAYRTRQSFWIDWPKTEMVRNDYDSFTVRSESGFQWYEWAEDAVVHLVRASQATEGATDD